MDSQTLAFTGATSLSTSGKVVSSDWAVGSYVSTGTSPSQAFIEHLTPPAYPVRTTSYYELSTKTSVHHDQGCSAASSGPSGLVILDYGQPKDWPVPVGHGWGSYLVNGHQKEVYREAKIADITAAVESFIDGYVQCDPTGVKAVYIAISINNDVSDAGAALNADHARAWAQMIKAVQAYAYSYPQIFVSAGIDAEPDFNPGNFGTGLSDTEMWMQAYNDTGVSPIYNFGSLDGYPCRPSGYPGFPPPFPCRQDSWDQDRDYNVSGGIDAARPVPEIYDSGFARYWYIVKRWGMERYPADTPLGFKGVMTECDGGLPQCQSNYHPQVPGGGPGLDYRQAWPILWLELDSDPAPGTIYPNWPTFIQNSASP